MRKLTMVVMLLAFTVVLAPNAHAKKLEDVTSEEVATGVQSFIANSPENLGKVAYKTITLAVKVIKFPFQQMEKLAE